MKQTQKIILMSALVSLAMCTKKQSNTKIVETELIVEEGGELPSTLVGITDTIKTSVGPLAIAPVWHGTVAFSISGKVIVVDPWSEGPAGRLPKADLVLITDIHFDHYDEKAIDEVRKTETIFIGPQAVADMFTETMVLENGDEHEALGVGVRAIPMYNTVRGPEPGKLFHDKGRGNGYVLTFGDTSVYVSGDTECIDEMKTLKDIDVAFVCMNLPYTMPPQEAAECISEFKPKILIPYHYRDSDPKELNTLISSDDAIEIRHRDFYAKP